MADIDLDNMCLDGTTPINADDMQFLETYCWSTVQAVLESEPLPCDNLAPTDYSFRGNCSAYDASATYSVDFSAASDVGVFSSLESFPTTASLDFSLISDALSPETCYPPHPRYETHQAYQAMYESHPGMMFDTSAATSTGFQQPPAPNTNPKVKKPSTKRGRKNYACPALDCTKRYGDKKSLYRHIRVHHPFTAQEMGIQEERWICGYPYCDKTFTREDNLTRHLSRRHSRQRKPR